MSVSYVLLCLDGIRIILLDVGFAGEVHDFVFRPNPLLYKTRPNISQAAQSDQLVVVARASYHDHGPIAPTDVDHVQIDTMSSSLQVATRCSHLGHVGRVRVGLRRAVLRSHLRLRERAGVWLQCHFRATDAAWLPAAARLSRHTGAHRVFGSCRKSV